MASSAKQFSLLILLITSLLSSLHTTHARDSQLFNKIPSTSTKDSVNVPNNINKDKETPQLNNQQQQEQQQEEQQPDFIPENENSYGLYGHESGQLPPSTVKTTTTTPYNTESSKQVPLPKYLPKNYNPTAYVTQPEPEDMLPDNTPFTAQKSYMTTSNNNNLYNNNERQNNYYNNDNQQLDDHEDDDQEETDQYTNNFNYNNYRLGSSFNSQPQDTSRGNYNNMYYNNVNNGGREIDHRYNMMPQGMSDTRHMENGKYFYDINNEKFSDNHPYQRFRTSGVSNNRNTYNYNDNNAEFNAGDVGSGYQNFQDREFQVDDNNFMP